MQAASPDNVLKVAAEAVESVRPLFAVAVFVRTDALEDVRASRLA